MSGRPFDVAVVGAGLVGLATARELLSRAPGLSVVVVDKEPTVGAHQSSHNSGVLHSGVYYAAGSLKARLCVTGKRALEAFADRHGVRVERTGKVIVAVREAELGRLAALHDRATANGVEGVRLIGPGELREIEPHAIGLRALYVPGTAIVDFGGVARAYADEVRAMGAILALRSPVQGLRSGVNEVVLSTGRADITARYVVACAGLQADRVAGPGSSDGPMILPFRGSFYRLAPAARDLVRGLIYPVPDPSLPFLGVHFTRRVDGEVWAGPNAVLALGREAYRRTDVDLREVARILAFPGTWRLARRHWRTGAYELARDLLKRLYLKDLRQYVPDVRAADLLPGPSGIRAQLVNRDGSLVDDFVLVGSGRVLRVLNAPSPAATASLAIGAHLAEDALARFDLGSGHAGR